MISIVMAYYNRLALLTHTLSTIQKTRHKNYEVVIVDDFSSSEQSCEHLHNIFPNMDIKVVKMSDIKPKKDYTNPCVPYNIGFKHSRGSKVILQNPECCHMGDILSHVEANLTDENYLVYHCYASRASDVQRLHKNEPIDYSANIINVEGGCWYNHATHRPCAYHFTSAITRNNLIKLNGFDERFATGSCYDDDELLHRIKLLKLDIKFIADPLVVHQYHCKIPDPNMPPITTNNQQLFGQVKLENNIKANNPWTLA